MRRLLIPAVAALLLFAACGEPGAEALNGDSRCRALAGLDPDARAQAVLRVSDEVGDPAPVIAVARADRDLLREAPRCDAARRLRPR